MAQTKLRWFQYSLRTLLVLVILCAFACSWLAVKLQQARRQREVVAEIREELGGRIHYDWQLDYRGSYLLNPQMPTPQWLRNLFGDDLFQSAGHVGIEGDKITDAVLELLKDFRYLRVLELTGSQVTDVGMKHLKGLHQLQQLVLKGGRFTDAGLEHLKGLNQLQYLDFTHTQITDAGLENLKGLSHLQVLDLANTQITDAGLENLKGLSHLQILIVSGTQVTDAGVKKLQQALPTCKILFFKAR
jgi:hypothetical protein